MDTMEALRPVIASCAPGVGAQERASRLMVAARDLVLRRGNTSAAARLTEALPRLRDGRLQVVVCGEFKQGKSTLINALLRAPGLLPTDIDVTTAVVTAIAWGEQERITAYTGEPGQESATILSRADLADYVTEAGNPNNRRRVRLVDIRLPSPLLAGGLTLIDTPGIGGIAIEHSEITYGFLPTADVVLFVTSAQAPLTTNEVEFLQRRVMPFRRHVVVAVNRIDRNRDWRLIVQEDRGKLAVALDQLPDTIPVMPVSARNFLDFLDGGDVQDAQDSRLPLLEEAITSHIAANGARLLIERAGEEIERALEEVRQPLVTALVACRTEAGAELDALEGRLKQAQARLEDLRDNNAVWRRDLNYGFQDIRRKAAYEEQTGAAKLRQELDRRLGTHSDLRDPPRIGREAAADLQTHRAFLTKFILEQYEELRLRTAEAAGIGLCGTMAGLPDTPEPDQAPDLAPFRRQHGVVSHTVKMGRSMSISGTGGGVAGATLGGIIGGLIGLFAGGVGMLPGSHLGAWIGGGLGSLLGTASGVREGLVDIGSRDDADARQQVQRVLSPFLTEGLSRVRRFQDELLTRLERGTVREFEAEIVRDKRIHDDSVREINARRPLSRAEANQQAAQLEMALSEVDRLLKSAEALRGAVPAAVMPPEAAGAVDGEGVEPPSRGQGAAADIDLAG